MRNNYCIKICGLIFVLLLMLEGTLNAQNRNFETSDDLRNNFYSEGIKYYLQHKYLLAEKNLSIWYNDNSWTKNAKGLSALADSYWINRRYKNAFEIYQRLKTVLRPSELASSLHVVKRLSDLDAMRGKYTTAAQVLSDVPVFKNKRDGFLLSDLYLRDSVNWIISTMDGNSGSVQRLPYLYNDKLIVTTDNYSTKKDNLNLHTDANFSKLGYLKKDATNLIDIDFGQKRGSLNNFAYVPSEYLKQLAILHENSDAPLINNSFLSKKSKNYSRGQANSIDIDPKFLFNTGNISIQKAANGAEPTAYFVGNNNDKESIKSYNKSDSSLIPVSLYAGEYVRDVYKGNYNETDKSVTIKNVRKMTINGFYGILLNASVSSDGKVMVFSGKDNVNADNYDLYYATRLNEDAWGHVTKFGANINTAGDEVFPQIQNDGALFFSSDGLPGLGALDIYYIPAFYKDRQINPNLSSIMPGHFGYPINSAFDDYGVFVSKDPVDKEYRVLDSLEGYFTTNRVGYDRIFYFKRKTNSATYSGKVLGKTLAGNYELLPAATVSSYRIVDNKDTVFVAQTITDSLGSYSFQLSPNYDYSIKGEKQEYTSSQVAFNPAGAKAKPIDNIYLDRLNNKDSLNEKEQPKDSLNKKKPNDLANNKDSLNKKDQLKDSLNKIKPNDLSKNKDSLNKKQPLNNDLSNNKKQSSRDSLNKKQPLNNLLNDKDLSNKKQPLNEELNNKKQLSKDVPENDKGNEIPEDIKRFIGGNEKYVKSWVIHHQFDKISIVEEDEKIFDSIAAFVKANNGIITKVYSTADCYGTLEHNDKLAKDRSVFVKADLESHGADRIVKIVGEGAGERMIPCPTVRDSINIARQLANRYSRVFVVVSNDQYKGAPQQNTKPSNVNVEEQSNENVSANKPSKNLSDNKQIAKEPANQEAVNKSIETTMPEDLKHYVKANERFVISWTLHHEFDKVDVIEDDDDILDNVVKYYKQHPNAVLRIYSTADCYGSDDHNSTLAKMRSVYIRGKLESLGLDRFVEVVGVGKGERMIGCPTVRDPENIARQVYNRYTKIFLVIDSKSYNVLPKSAGNTKSADIDDASLNLNKTVKNSSNKSVDNSIPDDVKSYIKKNEKLVKCWTIHHEFDRTSVAEEDGVVFESIAAYVKSHPNAIFRIHSTADCYGSDDHNSKLAKERSIFVKNTLVSYGVDKILEVVGIANGERILGCPNIRDSEHIARQIANRYTRIFAVVNK